MSIAVLKPLERRVRALLLSAQRPFTGRLIAHPEDALELAPTARILVVRLERIGDVLVGIPVIRAIRRRYPLATIDLLVSPANAGVADAVAPWVNRVRRYDKRVTAAVGLLRALRRERYDLMVDLVNGPSATSRILASWSGARQVLGVLHERPGLLTHAVPLLDRHRVHVVERTAQLLLAFGIDPAAEDLSLEYPLTASEQARAEALVPRRGRPLRLGVNLSGRGRAKYWGAEHFAEAIRWVQAHDPRFGVVVFGAPDYADDVRAVAAATGADALPPVASFHDFAAFIGTCDLLLTPDTSVVHVAAARRIPLVGLFRADPNMMPWSPYRTPHRAIVHEGPLGEVPRDEVLRALADLIAECFGRPAAAAGVTTG